MHGSRWGQYLERKHSPRLNHVARGAREGLFARGDEADLPRRYRRGDARGAIDHATEVVHLSGGFVEIEHLRDPGRHADPQTQAGLDRGSTRVGLIREDLRQRA